MSSQQDRSKQKLLDELRLTPIIQLACRKSGASRASYYRWRQESPEFAEAADQALEHSAGLINDLAESQLIAAIKDRNLGAIIFWLRSRHKSYQPRLKVDANVKHETEELTPEQAELVSKALKLAGLLPNEGERNDDEK